jgi:lipid-A-disaccharide synthase
MVRRVMMIAGEASGDLHGGGVVRELKKKVPSADVYGVGGDNMRREGMELSHHIAGLSFMGLVEVVRHLAKIRRVQNGLEVLLRERRPDVVVLIDYPGFNLRFARTAKRHGIPVLYYISPQVWAWNSGRVRKMKRLVDAMKVVFPFEVEIYDREGIDVEFVGHPIVERIGSSISRGDFLRGAGLSTEKKVVAIFPGSRMQEVERILPITLEAARRLQESHDVQVVVGVAPNLGRSVVERYVPEGGSVLLVENATYDLMKHADLAVVASGTATLEAGWFATPMIVVYRASPVTFWIGRLLVDLPHIGLVNIVAGKQIVPELVQHHLTAGNVVRAASRILLDAEYEQVMRRELRLIRERLGGPGASARVAEGVVRLGRAA